MTEEENLINIKRCPRFESCSIPKYPLDFWMSERIELPEDDQCPLRKILVKGKHRKRIKGILSATMRGLSKFIPNRNKSSDKPRGKIKVEPALAK
uniref:Uncharacterized protein n=1 Tax=viral metagenome TaxID=1070528 RepID=A0A6M3Y1E0_9ZZZZ